MQFLCKLQLNPPFFPNLPIHLEFQTTNKHKLGMENITFHIRVTLLFSWFSICVCGCLCFPSLMNVFYMFLEICSHTNLNQDISMNTPDMKIQQEVIRKIPGTWAKKLRTQKTNVHVPTTVSNQTGTTRPCTFHHATHCTQRSRCRVINALQRRTRKQKIMDDVTTSRSRTWNQAVSSTLHLKLLMHCSKAQFLLRDQAHEEFPLLRWHQRILGEMDMDPLVYCCVESLLLKQNAHIRSIMDRVMEIHVC